MPAPGNRDPLPDEIEACRPYLDAQLRHMQPKVVVTLGNFATKFILEQPIGITRARGHTYKRKGSTVIPTFHPAAALRGGRFGGMNPIDAIREDFRLVQRALEDAAAPSDPPRAPELERPRDPGPAQIGLDDWLAAGSAEPGPFRPKLDEPVAVPAAAHQLDLF